MKIAIYSRKSVFTGKGESIENQIELCREYCNRNYPGEEIEYLVYEDEGFSGGNTNRPEFKQMMKDAEQKKFDALICYRLDRISRNVADFSSTLEILQANDIDFISIKEQFDTSTPMGRAMVYISSVFAQLERETIAERVRDNMIQLAKSGRWLGGQIPTGFDSQRISYIDEEMKERNLVKLVPNEKELEIVKLVYKTYLNEHSIREVSRQLSAYGYKGKNGGNFDLTTVRRILRNPIYVISDSATHEYINSTGSSVFGKPNGNGYLTYNKKKQTTIGRNVKEWIVAVSNHKGVIPSDEWLRVQNLLDENKEKNQQSIRSGTGDNNACLSGILKCSKCGANMTIKYNTKNKDGISYIYYVCANKQKGLCDNRNIRVDKLDPIVISEIKNYNIDILIDNLKKSVDSVDNSSNDSQSNKLISMIAEKRTASSNLVKRLALADDNIANIIMEEIKSLNKEILDLEKNLENINNNTAETNNLKYDIKQLVDSLENYNKNIDVVEDVNQKRFLIRSVVDKVLWDGDNYKYKVKLLGMDDSKKK